MRATHYLGLTAACLALVHAVPAWAATTTRVIIVSAGQQPVPEERISLFNAETGAPVPREDDGDADGALYLLDGGRYRVMVDGELVREISVSGEGSETITIDLPPDANAPSPPPTPSAPPAQPTADEGGSGPSIFVIPGYQGFALPPTGIGVTRAGPPGVAPEQSAAETPRTVPQFGLQLGYAPNGAVTIEGFYFEGSETRPFAIPSTAGTDTGRVNGALSPGGSSGIIGPFGLDGEVRTEGLSYGFRVDLEVADTRDDDAAAPRPPGETWGEFEWHVFVEGVRQENEYDGVINGQTTIQGIPFGFTQEREQEVDETRVGVGTEGLLEVRINGDVRFTGAASAGVYHRWTSLDSVERNTCTFCPLVDRDFTIPIRDEDNGFGVHGALRAGLDFRLSPRVSIGIGARADYWSRVGQVFNPNSGDQVFFDGLTTGLRTTDAWSWGVGAGLGIRLGPGR